MTIFYVSSEAGRDSNAGTSASSPFATLQKAANLTRPGDTVEIMNGTYTNRGQYDVLDIRTSGTAGAPITYMAAPGQHPVINSSGSQVGIADEGGSYIVIKGLEVAGDALTNQTMHPGNGISIWNGVAGAHPTHVVIAHNNVHDEPGAGIWAGYGDYLTISHNTVYDNAKWTNLGNSGISVGWMYSSDSNMSGYKVRILANTVYGNDDPIPTVTGGGITDGNGIILDTNTSYNGRILVENNLAYGNGGAGVAVWETNNVNAIYNTFYGNDTDVSTGHNNGQIWFGGGTGGNAQNNIIVGPGNLPLSKVLTGASATFNYNDYYGTSSTVVHGTKDINANPMFVNPGSNFRLQAGSPAINAANPGYTTATDILDNPRPSGGGYDLGAYELQSSQMKSSNISSTTATHDTLTLNLSGDVWEGGPEFIVSIDGKQLGGPQTVTAVHSAAQTETFDFTGMFGLGTHDIAVSFINDAWGGTAQADRNLYVNSLSYNGVQDNPSHGGVLDLLTSDGTVHFIVDTPS